MRPRTWFILVVLVTALAAEGGALVWLHNSNTRAEEDIEEVSARATELEEQLDAAKKDGERIETAINEARAETNQLRDELEAAKEGEAATVIQLFEPFDSDGLLDPSIQTRETTGDCDSGSFADSGRPEAWRCFAGSEIHDPCFESPDRTVVACFDSPDQTTDVVLITPNTPLAPAPTNGGSPEDAPPWQIELSDGRSCFYMGGATFAVGNLRANFSCEGGGIVFGDPDRTESTWTIPYASGSDSEVLDQANSGSLTEASLQQVPIAVAWY